MSSRLGETMSPMGVLMLVRHGQASFGSEDYDVLSSRGVRQSRKVAEIAGRLRRRADHA